MSKTKDVKLQLKVYAKIAVERNTRMSNLTIFPGATGSPRDMTGLLEF